MNRCMNRFMDGGWIDGQECRWVSMDRRMAGVSLRVRWARRFQRTPSTASVLVLSRLAPGHAPLWEHLQESALHDRVAILGAGSSPLSTLRQERTLCLCGGGGWRDTKTAGAEGSGNAAEACCLATTEENLEK